MSARSNPEMTARTAQMHKADELLFVEASDDLQHFTFSAQSSRDKDVTYSVVWHAAEKRAECSCPAGQHAAERGVTCWHMDLVEQAYFDQMAFLIVDGCGGDLKKLEQMGRKARQRIDAFGEFWALANPLDLCVYEQTRLAYAKIIKQQKEQSGGNSNERQDASLTV